VGKWKSYERNVSVSVNRSGIISTSKSKSMSDESIELVPKEKKEKGEGEENVLQNEHLKLEAGGRVDDEAFGGFSVDQFSSTKMKRWKNNSRWRTGEHKCMCILLNVEWCTHVAAIDKEKKVYFEVWQRRE
jgi:hypothetical protein